MKLQEAVQDYLRYIEYERGLAKTTISDSAGWFRHLMRWLGENGYPDPDLDAFSTPTLRRYLYHLSGSLGYRPRTVIAIFYPMRALGQFLVANGVFATNPVAALTMPKKDAAQRLTVSDEEIALLLQACERQPTPRQIAFSRAILAVLVYGGLRRNELLDLKLGDINLKEGSILVRSGKGSKSRKVFVCEDCTITLREWLALREPHCKHDWLFAFDPNRRIYDDGLRVLVERLKATAGLADHANIKPHALRHACATRLMRNGADIRSIQAFLGHSQLTTTAMYLHTNEEQLRNIAHLSTLRQPASNPAPSEKESIRRLPFSERVRSRRIPR